LRHVVEGTQTLKILGCGVDLYDSGWKNWRFFENINKV
jgi:hypothetical protein